MDNKFQKIKVNDTEYYIVDSKQNLIAEDSFIHPENKLEMFTGSGESRKYVGSYIGESGKKLGHFFEYNNWGNVKDENGNRTYPILQDGNCFFSKSNLLKYMEDAKQEYLNKEQVYQNNISNFFDEKKETIQNLNNELNFFSIFDVSDFTDNELSRAYIRSKEEIWTTWRKLILPKISYLSILKITPCKGLGAREKTLYYFRIFLDYQFRPISHPSSLPTQPNGQKYSYTDPQRTNPYRDPKFRKKVIKYMPQCPFTQISDDRVLIASHIKPWKVCINEGKKDEADDYLNGLSLSPTYDLLFDRGYITFNDNGELICSTQFSSYTWEALRINPTSKNKLRIYPEGREKYLAFHREKVFQH